MKRNWKKAAPVLALCALLAIGLTMFAVADHRFKDVPSNHWAADAIEESVAVGLFQGKTNGTFGLGQEMSRAAFATALNRLFGWQALTPQFPTFSDVAQSDWYFSAVETACANGAVSRQSAEFRPSDAITREEMAVMLVRALNYDTLSGLAQDLPSSFQDLTTNTGYVSVAHELGLMTGMTATHFAPSDPATREQAAVVLMRLYHKLHQGAPAVSAVCGAEGLETDRPMETVAIAAARLTAPGGQVQLGLPISRQEAAQLGTDAQAKGAKALLLVSGDASSLQGDAQASAALLAEEVKNGPWDGIQLDFSQLTSAEKAPFTALVTALRAALPDKLLFVTAEAPAWNGTAYGGYDHIALANLADRLILHIAPGADTNENLPIASPEPLEEVYYALSTLTKKIDPSKLSLLLTTTGSQWSGTGAYARADGVLTAAAIEDLRDGTDSYYYTRHQAAYLVKGSQNPQTVWYLDEAAMAARLRMAAFWGVNQVTLSDGGSVADYEGYSIANVLWHS